MEVAGIKGANPITERLEIREVGGELWRCGLKFTGRGNVWCKDGSGNGSGGMEKMATGDGSHVREGWCGWGIVSRRRVGEEKTYTEATENTEFTEKRNPRAQSGVTVPQLLDVTAAVEEVEYRWREADRWWREAG